MLDTEIRKLAAQKQWDELINSDQVRILTFNFNPDT
uniref:Uncharacterized protein n=1 Tax=Rhizophora mucronata TaxID=61149 RepID=A0A2P2IP28_RHIMU